MRDNFPTGPWATGSPGDPEPDAVLPAGMAEFMLDGRAGAVTTELRPLAEALAALRAAPSLSEFRGEDAVLAAFRSMHGLSGPAPTRPLEAIPGTAGHRLRPRARRRARHAAPSAPRRSPARPSAGRRLGLATATAAAFVLIMGVVAYSGYLPGPVQSAAHVVIGAPPAPHHTTVRPTVSATGGAGLSGSGAPAVEHPTATPTPSRAATATAPAQGPRQRCQAYFKNPWRPGSRSWDKTDFTKLAKAAGGPQWVLRYCFTYLKGQPWWGSPGFRFPNGFDGGVWAWTPGSQVTGPGQPGTGPAQAAGTGSVSTGSVSTASTGTSGRAANPDASVIPGSTSATATAPKTGLTAKP